MFSCNFTGGRSWHKSCPPGLHFNAKSSNCDWPANADCKVGPTDPPPPTTAPPPTEEPEPTTEPKPTEPIPGIYILPLNPNLLSLSQVFRSYH